MELRRPPSCVSARRLAAAERVQVHERMDAAVALPVEQSSQGPLVAAPVEPDSAEIPTSMLLQAAPVEQHEAYAEAGVVQSV